MMEPSPKYQGTKPPRATCLTAHSSSPVLYFSKGTDTHLTFKTLLHSFRLTERALLGTQSSLQAITYCDPIISIPVFSDVLLQTKLLKVPFKTGTVNLPCGKY